MKRKVPWILWLLSTIVMVMYLSNTMRSETADRGLFLPGVTTVGHYQIELACQVCHTPGMGVLQDACINCHGAELETASDSHPPKKFKPLDKADLVERLDARFCITCHQEHAADRTHAMGLTLPTDYCYHCHRDIAETRPNHAEFAFDSCASSGCHNFHDNRALNEPFLTAHLDTPDFLPVMTVAARAPVEIKPVAAPDAPASKMTDPHVLDDFAASAHARAGVNCTACHTAPDDTTWIDKPDHTACARCHDHEAAGFLAGRHGMRLSQNMPPMTPAEARLPFKPEAAHRALTCNTCHGSHRYDTQTAAAESCMKCHDDPHTRAYAGSPHAKLWAAELAGEGAANTGVSCATCHLPREPHREGDEEVVRVQHNQNDNLRPNEKMMRNVCLKCHGAQFSLDALADRALIDRNFTGQPAGHVESLDLIRTKITDLARKRAGRNKPKP